MFSSWISLLYQVCWRRSLLSQQHLRFSPNTKCQNPEYTLPVVRNKMRNHTPVTRMKMVLAAVPLPCTMLFCSICSTLMAMLDTFWAIAWILSTSPAGWNLCTQQHRNTSEVELKPKQKLGCSQTVVTHWSATYLSLNLCRSKNKCVCQSKGQT